MSRPTRRAPHILVVDDDPGLLRLLTIRLRSQNYVVEPADGPARALAAVSRFRPDLVITDLRMAAMDGISLLRELQRRWPSLNVIILTAHGTIPDAVKATQSGAFAFLTKPVDKDQLLDEVRRALKTSGFSDTGGDDWRAEFATRSPLMEERLAKAHMVAGTDAAVLITGGPGTGKELLAKAIHRASARRDAAFVVLDCGQLEPSTGETEIAGAIARAGAGTLQLSDVDDLPPALRPALARLVGSQQARIVATSDRAPDEPAGEDYGSRHLMDELGAVQVELPPLDRRREDIPLLVQQCLDDVSAETSHPKRSCSPEAMELLASARWPGNVRQLRMVVRQAAAAGAGAVITADQVQEAQGQITQLPGFDEARDEFTRGYLVQLLKVTQGNVSQAARLAKRNRTDFYKLLARHGVEPEDFK
jgi:two-component system response regulator GlrR